MDTNNEKGYVTEGKINKIVYELKNEIQQIDNKLEKNVLEMKHETSSLTNTLNNLNENIQKQTDMMTENILESKLLRNDLNNMQKENISRDHNIEGLMKFREDADSKESSRFKEFMTFGGILMGVIGSIAVAIINIFPALFGQ